MHSAVLANDIAGVSGIVYGNSELHWPTDFVIRWPFFKLGLYQAESSTSYGWPHDVLHQTLRTSGPEV